MKNLYAEHHFPHKRDDNKAHEDAVEKHTHTHTPRKTKMLSVLNYLPRVHPRASCDRSDPGDHAQISQWGPGLQNGWPVRSLALT